MVLEKIQKENDIKKLTPEELEKILTVQDVVDYIEANQK